MTISTCNLVATPKVSFLVPAWNEARNLDAHVQSFQDLTYSNKELILCAGGNDGSYEIASRYQSTNIHVLEQIAGEGKQSALRRSLELAKGEIIYLTDADCIFNEQAFSCALMPLINEKELATTGRYAPLLQQRRHPLVLMQWYVDNYARALSPAYVEGLIGRNAAIWRKTLEEVGAFDEPVKIGTDYFLARKLAQAGKRVCYVNDSAVETEFKTTLGGYLRQQ